VFIEGLFFALNIGHSEGHHVYITQPDGQPGTVHQKDELLGYKLVPNNQIHVIEVSRKRTTYEATYTINEYSRRMTPVENPGHRPHDILFFGDSFTFGYGVNDNETLPFFVGQFASAYQPHNYGISGQGPQQLFAILQDEGVTEGISRQDGGHIIGIYIFINKHIYRAIGTMKMHNRFGDVSPYYVLHDDELVRKGTMVSGRPVLSIVYPILGSSQTIRYFQFDFPEINDGHLRLTTKMIVEARNNFTEKFNSEEFYVILYPSSGELLIPYLETAGLEYLNYSDVFSPRETGLSIPYDGHPTPQAYRILAEKLTKDLGIYDYDPSE
jgi:hypothetical protein